MRRTTARWRRDEECRGRLLALPGRDPDRHHVLHRAGADGPMTDEKSRGFLRDNSLSLVFGAVFLATLVGQALSGVADFNAQQIANGLEPVSLGDYVTSSSFMVDVMENWQSEYLQFFLYIFATVWLVQRGSAESKEPGKEGTESDEEQKLGPHADEDSPAWARTEGWRRVLFSRSLGVLMGTLFLLTWG